jgi:GTPase SAR1 family protein
MSITYNEEQTKAIKAILTFVDKPMNADPNHKNNNLLLIGAAGSGKTTVMKAVIKQLRGKSIAFSSFTNKATQVLSAHNLEVVFMTLHKLLCLDLKYDINDRLTFKFNRRVAAENFNKYDLIIVDECSIVGADLWNYIEETRRIANRKFIFLGDIWQLPPVDEIISQVFSVGNSNNWVKCVLNKQMRFSGTSAINDKLRSVIISIKTIADKTLPPEQKKFHSKIIKSYYLDLIPQTHIIKNIPDKLRSLISEDRSCIVITYSKFSVDKINMEMSKCENLNKISFNPGDKCCFDIPFIVGDIKEITINTVELEEPKTTTTIYNGDTYTITSVEEKFVTSRIHRLCDIPATKCQLLKISNKYSTYQVIHIDKENMNLIKTAIKKQLDQKSYLNEWRIFCNLHPQISYGYAITTYKCQGSEWDDIIVNINSIINCVGSDYIILFKHIYTAISRAKSTVWATNIY